MFFTLLQTFLWLKNNPVWPMLPSCCHLSSSLSSVWCPWLLQCSSASSSTRGTAMTLRGTMGWQDHIRDKGHCKMVGMRNKIDSSPSVDYPESVVHDDSSKSGLCCRTILVLKKIQEPLTQVNFKTISWLWFIKILYMEHHLCVHQDIHNDVLRLMCQCKEPFHD